MASDQLKGGRLNNLGDSLAQYLEEAFDFIRVNDYGLDHLTPEGQDERMMLFLGIGQGVVRYLAEHGAAFVVEAHGASPSHSDTDTGHIQISALNEGFSP